jgi:poly(3-hydroxybutyrate) depolymerase
VVGTATVHGHTIGVVVDTSVPGTAQLSLLNRRHVVARRHYHVRPGRALLRLRAPVTAHGRLTLVIVFHGSDGQSVTTRRTVRIR